MPTYFYTDTLWPDQIHLNVSPMECGVHRRRSAAVRDVLLYHHLVVWQTFVLPFNFSFGSVQLCSVDWHQSPSTGWSFMTRVSEGTRLTTASRGPTPAFLHMCWWEGPEQRAPPVAPGLRLPNANVRRGERSRAVCWCCCCCWSAVRLHVTVDVSKFSESDPAHTVPHGSKCCACSGDLSSTWGHRKRLCDRCRPQPVRLHGDRGVRLPRWLRAGRKPSKHLSAGWRVVWEAVLQW